jgi:hypothetical protein
MSTAADPVAAEAAMADAIAAAVLGCPAVAALHPGGMVHRTATYLPRRRVEGVHVDDDQIAVSVVGVQGIPIALLADQVRAAVMPFADGRPVDVHVADVQPLSEQPPALPAAFPA